MRMVEGVCGHGAARGALAWAVGRREVVVTGQGYAGGTQGLGARRAQESPTRHDSAQSKNSLRHPLWEPVMVLSKWHLGTIEHGSIRA